MNSRAFIVRLACSASCAAMFGWSTGASAQDRRPGTEAGRGFFEIGYAALDLDALNTSLTTAGYPRLNGSMLTFGGGGYGDRGHWLFGGEGHGLLGDDKNTTDGAYQVSLSGGYGMFRIGYKVVQRRSVDVYPSVGIGGGGISLDIKGRSAPLFGDILANPARSSHLSTGSFLLDVGVSANYLIHTPQKTAEAEGGLVIGVNAGYTFAPGTPKWELDGINSVSGGPSVKLQGFHVRFAFGGWSRKPHQ